MTTPLAGTAKPSHLRPASDRGQDTHHPGCGDERVSPTAAPPCSPGLPLGLKGRGHLRLSPGSRRLARKALSRTRCSGRPMVWPSTVCLSSLGQAAGAKSTPRPGWLLCGCLSLGLGPLIGAEARWRRRGMTTLGTQPLWPHLPQAELGSRRGPAEPHPHRSPGPRARGLSVLRIKTSFHACFVVSRCLHLALSPHNHIKISFSRTENYVYRAQKPEPEATGSDCGV